MEWFSLAMLSWRLLIKERANGLEWIGNEWNGKARMGLEWEGLE